MGANISLPPIPDTADAKMKEYLSALTKVLQQKQVDDYSSLQKVASDNNVSISQIKSGTTSDLSVQLGAGIIETGSNTNGRWIKFSDGTMKCWWQDTTARTTSFQDSPNYYYSASITFPCSFYSVPIVSCGHLGLNGQCWMTFVPVSVSGCVLYLSSDLSTKTGYPGYIAIGRWKA